MMNSNMNLRRWNVLVLFLGLCLCVSAQKTKELYIFHTNDMHSCVVPLGRNNPDPEQVDKAGMVRRISFLKEMRKQYPDMLLFDCGDFSQGSPYYTMFKGDTEIRLMNLMGYDAGTIGNHEFDFGLENMARLFKMANFPIVCANYSVKGTVLEKVVKPYVIIRRNGIKIGVFGLSPHMEGLVQEKNFSNMIFKDPIRVANEVAAYLKNKKHCDLVICLSHLGWTGKESDEALIPATRNIDIVLGGHSHSYFTEPIYYKNLDGVEVPLQQMGKNGQFIGRMFLKMEKK